MFLIRFFFFTHISSCRSCLQLSPCISPAILTIKSLRLLSMCAVLHWSAETFLSACDFVFSFPQYLAAFRMFLGVNLMAVDVRPPQPLHRHAQRAT